LHKRSRPHMERVDLRGEVSQRRFLDLRLDEGFACFGQLGCEISFGVSLRRHLLSPLLRRQSPPMPTDGAHNPACPAEKAVGQAERGGVLALPIQYLHSPRHRSVALSAQQSGADSERPDFQQVANAKRKWSD
jgi:hypothetical protein